MWAVLVQSEDSTSFPFALEENENEGLDDCDLDGLRKSLSLEPVDGVAGTRSFSASTSDAAVGALVHMLQGILDTACCLSMTFCSRVIGHGDYYFRC